MSDSKNSAAEAMPAGAGNFVGFNHKYKKIICSGSGCGTVITFDELGQHLGRKHHVGPGISDQVTKVARRLGWEEKLPGDVRPEGGMAPQVGLSVWDGFRCKHCRQYVTIFPDDVDVHCEYNGHGMKEGNNAEKVRFQSWHRSFFGWV